MTPTERARLIDEQERKAESADLMQRALAYSLAKRSDKDERVTASIMRGYISPLLKQKQSTTVDDTIIHTIEGRSLTMAGWAKRLGLSNCDLRQRIMRSGSLNDVVKDHYNRKTTAKVYNATAPEAPTQITRATIYKVSDESSVKSSRGRLYTAKGKSQTISQWASELGIASRTMRDRLSRMPIEKAVLPFRRGNPTHHIYEINGERLTLRQWAKRYGIDVTTVHYRMKRGVPLEEALTLPKYYKVTPNADTTPGVCEDLLTFEGTGGGSTAQEISEISFSARTNV